MGLHDRDIEPAPESSNGQPGNRPPGEWGRDRDPPPRLVGPPRLVAARPRRVRRPAGPPARPCAALVHRAQRGVHDDGGAAARGPARAAAPSAPARLAWTCDHRVPAPGLPARRLGRDLAGSVSIRGWPTGIVIFATGCAATSSAAFARTGRARPRAVADRDAGDHAAGPAHRARRSPSRWRVPTSRSGWARSWRGWHWWSGCRCACRWPSAGSPAPRACARWGPAIDGLMVWLVVFYGFGVMDGLTPRLLADPSWVAIAATTRRLRRRFRAERLHGALPRGLRPPHRGRRPD